MDGPKYNDRQWKQIADWLGRHIKLVCEYGFDAAEQAAWRSRLPKYMTEAGWSELPWKRPTRTQLVDVSRSYSLLPPAEIDKAVKKRIRLRRPTKKNPSPTVPVQGV